MAWRRVIILAVAYLLCGFVVNVLVASAIAIWVEPNRLPTWGQNIDPEGADGRWLRVHGWVPLPEMYPYSYVLQEHVMKGPGLQRVLFEEYGESDPEAFILSGLVPGRTIANRTRAGWPFFSLQGAQFGRNISTWSHESAPQTSVITNTEATWVFILNETRSGSLAIGHVPGQRWHIIPVTPIMPGVMYNTLFYAAILLGVHQGFVAIKRAFRRKRRGLCPQCRYNLRGDFAGGCPECGWGR